MKGRWLPCNGQGIVQAQVMQTTSRFPNQIIKTGAEVAKDIAHDRVDLDATDTMFDTDALAGNDGIGRFLWRCQFTPFRLLLGLKGVNLIRFVTLKSGVFPQLAAHWKGDAVFIGQLLVVCLAFTSRAEHLDLARGFVTDDIVLDCMPFLLAAVVLARLLPVFGTPDRTFGAINDERQTRTSRHNLADVPGLASGQSALVPQRLVQDRGQTMNPFIGLRLSQSKPVALHHLYRIVLEVEQDEYQLVFQLAQCAAASASAPSLPRLFPLLVAPIQVGFIPLGKGWQQLVEGSQPQPRETAENGRLMFQARIGNQRLLPLVIGLHHSIPMSFNSDRVY
jgi:hypothetical protein